ncbi:MAG: hypothetical protein AAGH41_00575 [Pseudomonadota bacterium]
MIFPAVVLKLIVVTFSSVIGLSVADFVQTVRESRTTESRVAEKDADAPDLGSINSN